MRKRNLGARSMFFSFFWHNFGQIPSIRGLPEAAGTSFSRSIFFLLKATRVYYLFFENTNETFWISGTRHFARISENTFMVLNGSNLVRFHFWARIRNQRDLRNSKTVSNPNFDVIIQPKFKLFYIFISIIFNPFYNFFSFSYQLWLYSFFHFFIIFLLQIEKFYLKWKKY